jgi:hypothetical protein
MATFPVGTGARMLGIHSKTLHHWLKEANLSLAPHPTDARMACVAEEHPPSGGQTTWTSLPGSSFCCAAVWTLCARVARGASKFLACP